MSRRVKVLTPLLGVLAIGGGVLWPSLAAAQTARERCLDEADNPPLAACNAALRADPRDAEVYQARGTAFVRKGENDRALADYNDAIRLKPEFALPYFNRGLILESQNQLPQALSDFKRSAELDPSDNDSEMAAARITAILANRGSPPARAGSVPAAPRIVAATSPAPAATSAAPARTSAVPTRTSAMPARVSPAPLTNGSAAATANSAPTTARPLPAAASSVAARPGPVAVAAAARPLPAAASPVPAEPPAPATFSAAAVGNWISGQRNRPAASASTNAAPASADTANSQPVERRSILSTASTNAPSDNSIIETQEYWNDQMALANGGSSNTRRIISLERLGELQKSGILSKQEFESEKRRILGE